MLPLHALSPIGSVQDAAQPEIRHHENGMHWLDGGSKISIVGGHFSGTFEGWTDG